MTHRRPGHSLGLVFDTRELVRRAGERKQVTRVAEAPDGIGVAMIAVPPGSPVAFELALEAVVEGVLVTGTAGVQLLGQCARCLEELTSSLEVDLQELFVYPGKDDDDPDASRIEDESIDLEPLLRDAVVLELPFTPLCQSDCAGLCPECGANLNRDPEHSHGDATDPRWAALGEWTTPQPNPDGLTSRPTSKE